MSPLWACRVTKEFPRALRHDQTYSCWTRQSLLSTKRHQSSNAGSKDESVAQTSPPLKASNHSVGPNSAQPGDTRCQNDAAPIDWDENPNYNIRAFSDLPSTNFGINQHILINNEFKEALRQILWRFRAPIRYAFAYGSGVFPQSEQNPSTMQPHSHSDSAVSKLQGGSGSMIDFIFGVSYTQHWHSINLHEHRNHYSGAGSLGSSIISSLQDNIGAGVYFNPYVTVNGTLIKYGVVNLDTLCRDLATWDTMYLAGRLQKPVKILRDDPRVRLANQVNLISAVRTALLLLPAEFTERDLYRTITGLSYLGDPRMSLGGENLNKVDNIVRHQLSNFRRLYAPLIHNLPNIVFKDSQCTSPSWFDDTNINAILVQDMDPQKRANIVRRLPQKFREKLYFQYQAKFQISGRDFDLLMEETNEDRERVTSKLGGSFERRIAQDTQASLTKEVNDALTGIIKWPSYTQSLKGIVTGGLARAWRYASEKWQKNREGKRAKKEELRKRKFD